MAGKGTLMEALEFLVNRRSKGPMKRTKTSPPLKTLQKSSTGIRGLDEITYGGLPKMRPTLVCGAAGCGKTLLAMEFLVRGAIEFDEPGVAVGHHGECKFRAVPADI